MMLKMMGGAPEQAGAGDGNPHGMHGMSRGHDMSGSHGGDGAYQVPVAPHARDSQRPGHGSDEGHPDQGR